MSFLKNIFNRKGDIIPSEPIFPGESFTIFKLSFPDGWGLASANKAYDNYPNKSFYAWHVLIELEVIDKNENGHPVDSEAAKLNAIENKINVFLKKYQTVHFVARITRNGFRDLLFYIDKPIINQRQLTTFCDDIMKMRVLNFTIHKDPEWKAVGFIK